MFRKIRADVKMPFLESEYDPYITIYANEDICISRDDSARIELGISLRFEMVKVIMWYSQMNSEVKKQEKEWFLKTHYCELKLHSSLQHSGLFSESQTIKLNNENELSMMIYNHGSETKYIKKHQAIAEIMLLEHKTHLITSLAKI